MSLITLGYIAYSRLLQHILYYHFLGTDASGLKRLLFKQMSHAKFCMCLH
jgi:hypothetical protein